MSGLTVRPVQPADHRVWNTHVEISNNGTLFHDLDFLSYHSADRFDFRHLIVERDGRIEAVVPGAVRRDGVFVSPAGASVGGPAVRRSLAAEQALALVEALQNYARAQHWDGLEFALPPPVYHHSPNQLVEFALTLKGFSLTNRALSFLLPLRRGATDHYQALFAQSRRSYVRANRRKGVTTREAGAEAVDAFLELFQETYDRLGTSATHTPSEIVDLLRRLPHRVRLWLAWLGETAIAGSLVFVLNPNVCCTFYICDRLSHRDHHGVTVLLADLLDTLAQRDFRYLDLGPSASSTHFNRGVVYFKESLGAQAFCRDSWRWNV
jgi:Acetyltransferase (GNAT) domain